MSSVIRNKIILALKNILGCKVLVTFVALSLLVIFYIRAKVSDELQLEGEILNDGVTCRKMVFQMNCC